MTLLTAEEAALLARCDPRVIRRAIKAGELEALFSSRWLLDERVVLAWLAGRGRERAGSRREVARRPSRPVQRRDDRAGSVSRLADIERKGQAA